MLLLQRIKKYRGKKNALKFAKRTKNLIDIASKGIGQEALETREMANSFFRLLSARLNVSGRSTPPTEQEIAEAIEQLKDVGRFTLFTGISILPGGGFSLIGLELLARKMGVKNFTLIPSSFRKNKPEENTDFSNTEILT